MAGTICVTSRFNAEQVRRIRKAAKARGVTLATFIRISALLAAKAALPDVTTGHT
jgi:uncharacterized protein (DUF1778 family)